MHSKDPQHPLDALSQACANFPDGGIKALAELRGVTKDSLYKKLQKRVDTHRIGYDEELSDILDQLKAGGVKSWDSTLHALCHRHGGVFVRLPDSRDDTLGHGRMITEQLLRMVKEQGDVAAVLVEALNGDGDIDSKELKAFDIQHEEALAAMVALGETVRALNKQAVKAGRVK